MRTEIELWTILAIWFLGFFLSWVIVGLLGIGDDDPEPWGVFYCAAWPITLPLTAIVGAAIVLYDFGAWLARRQP